MAVHVQNVIHACHLFKSGRRLPSSSLPPALPSPALPSFHCRVFPLELVGLRNRLLLAEMTHGGSIRGEKRKRGEPPKKRRRAGSSTVVPLWKQKADCSERRRERKRHRGDSNPCGQSPMDFESISLAARTQCLMLVDKINCVHAGSQKSERHHTCRFRIFKQRP